MRPFLNLSVLAIALIAQQGLAAEWHWYRSQDGESRFVYFYNDSGIWGEDVTPNDPNQIFVVRSSDLQDLGEDGRCSFDNCTAMIYVNGRAAQAGEGVHILFSNGFELNFKQGPNVDEVLLSNHYASSMGAMNYFDEYLQTQSWVEVCFGADCHRFDLSGSASAKNEMLNSHK